MKQIPLAIGPEPARTFENFLPGANGEALAHLLALAPGAPPVYLWGPAGSGKTHLLHALVERAAAHGQQAAWFSAATPAPWSDDRRARLARHRRRARARRRRSSRRRSRSSSTRRRAAPASSPPAAVPPVDLAVREDLRTRLGWGHVFALAPLGEAEVRAALRREADRRGTFLSDEVMDYLLTRFARDLKHLMAQLDRLDEFSLASKRAITVPLLKQMLAEEGALP